MSFRTKLLLILAALLLTTASLALAATAAPDAPQAPAVTAAQPPAALSPAGPACKGADLPLFSPAPQTTANDTCGGCSDAACAGKPINSVCGSGFRCLVSGPSCSTVAIYRCKCLII
jgi:hypothetical protein